MTIDLSKLTGAELITVYNSIADAQVTRFSDRKTAERRIRSAMGQAFMTEEHFAKRFPDLAERVGLVAETAPDLFAAPAAKAEEVVEQGAEAPAPKKDKKADAPKKSGRSLTPDMLKAIRLLDRAEGASLKELREATGRKTAMGLLRAVSKRAASKDWTILQNSGTGADLGRSIADFRTGGKAYKLVGPNPEAGAEQDAVEALS
jgi:hypothetical protein